MVLSCTMLETMAVFRRGTTWWFEFTFCGKRIRESAKTSRKTIAAEAEKRRRLELEKARAGMPSESGEERINRVSDSVKSYLRHYASNHRAKSVIFATQRLAHVERLIGKLLFIDVTEARIREYIETRLEEGAGGRTINMELGELSRVMGHTWRELWPKVRKMEERHDVGRALSVAEETALLRAAAADDSPNRNPMLYTFLKIALSTGMRSGEISTLTWGQVDLEAGVITVGTAKTEAGRGRQIPMNSDLRATMETHLAWFVEKMRRLGYGDLSQGWYVFPGRAGKPTQGALRPMDPTRPTTSIKTAWESLRETAGVSCRLHDLRHTCATKLAEAGVSEGTMKAILGHMSRQMLEKYSHIRLQAKREAMDAVTLPSHSPQNAALANELPTESTTVKATHRIQ